jgi:hypothetical protein
LSEIEAAPVPGEKTPQDARSVSGQLGLLRLQTESQWRCAMRIGRKFDPHQLRAERSQDGEAGRGRIRPPPFIRLPKVLLARIPCSAPTNITERTSPREVT